MMDRDGERLQRLQALRSDVRVQAQLGAEIVRFFRRDVDRRCRRFSLVADRWATLVPEPLLAHTALESFNAGTLTVLVDSSAHLYDLRQLLLAGLEKQLCLACAAAGLRQVRLRMGRWYEGDRPADRRPRFD